MTSKCKECAPGCFGQEIKNGITSQNALFVKSLGICSAIALTGYLDTALVISVVILLAATISSFLVSLFKAYISRGMRFLVEVTIITTIVTGIHIFFKFYWHDMLYALGPYLGLVITNCLIMDSCERISFNHKPFDSVKITFAGSAGYVLIFLLVALIREPLGNGSFFRIALFGEGIRPVKILSAAPGAFFILGIIWWVIRASMLSKMAKNKENE